MKTLQSIDAIHTGGILHRKEERAAKGEPRSRISAEILERVSGIEPPSPAWKAGIITTIRHPHDREVKELFERSL